MSYLWIAVYAISPAKLSTSCSQNVDNLNRKITFVLSQ